jgi:hypothetical protein
MKRASTRSRHYRRKGLFDLAAGAGLENVDRQLDQAGNLLRVSQCSLRNHWISGIDQHGHTAGLGHELMQEFQALGDHLLAKKIYSCRVATRPGEARDQTKLDRVFADAEHDRYRRSCGLRRERSGSVSGHGDHRHATANQLGYRRPHAIVSALQPVVLDRDILAINITNFPKTHAESGRIPRESIGRSHDESNNRQCRLLRACRQRPRRRCAASLR